VNIIHRPFDIFESDRQDAEGNLYRPSNDYRIDTNPDSPDVFSVYVLSRTLDVFSDAKITPHKVRLESQRVYTQYREVESVEVSNGRIYEIYHFVTVINYIWKVVSTTENHFNPVQFITKEGDQQ